VRPCSGAMQRHVDIPNKCTRKEGFCVHWQTNTTARSHLSTVPEPGNTQRQCTRNCDVRAPLLANTAVLIKTFTTKSGARIHSKLHLNNRVKYPCPLAEEYGCSSVFTTKSVANNHAKTHTLPFLCPRRDCPARFATLKDALEHADSLQHQAKKYFLCPLPICRSAVAGKRLSKDDIEKHRKRHIRLGHMESDFEFIPQQVEPLSLQSDLPLYLLILQHNSLDCTNEDQGYEFLKGSLTIIEIYILKMLISIMHPTEAQVMRMSKMNRPNKNKNCAALEVGYSLKSIASAFLSTIPLNGVCDALFQFSWINK
jgi:hypothetical protein